ncbi:MAG: ATP-binding protein, partial [Polyangiaceae bacterium]|nr:ATP-binding protein [Polyangiaceae bacterium]
MTRRFNTAGANAPSAHYTLDPFGRIDWPQIRELIDEERYFVLHAPRQTGKTTLLNAIVESLNTEGKYEALYVNVEDSRVARNDYRAGNREIASTVILSARVMYPDGWLAQEGKHFTAACEPGTLLKALLTEWTIRANKRTVLMIDEIDSLIGDTLVSVLHQLRAGYNARPLAFPQSVILCGVRDVRDYRIQTSEGESITGGSCFNIKAESLRLGCFSYEDVRELYGQHTEETGQTFDEPVFPKVMSLTGGQPWLVNALARELTQKMPELRDRSRKIGLDDLDEAKERLILRRDTHLDQLAHKLGDDRVRRTIAPILAGEKWDAAFPQDDLQYVVDLGLVVDCGDTGPR